MMEPLTSRRIDLIITLFANLKTIRENILTIGSEIETAGSGLYLDMFREYCHEIKDKTEKYNHNIENMLNLNQDMLSGINQWYSFVKSPDEAKKLTYPLKFIINKRKLKKNISKINQMISKTLIENRFLKEDLNNWEHEFSRKVVQKMNQGKDYQYYENLNRQYKQFIHDLKYLIPSIPDLCPTEIHLDKPDSFLARLSKMTAA